MSYGGYPDPVNKDRIGPGEAEPIPFSFNISSERFSGRDIDKIIVTDILPSYENSKGEIVWAYFDPDLNPGWKDNEDGTVTFVMGDTNWNHQGLGLNNKTVLYLSFPDAQFKDGEKNVKFINKVQIEGVSYNSGKNEEYYAEDSISFYQTADDMSGMGMLAKRAGFGHGYVTYDKYGLWAERVKYDVRLSNKLSTPLKEIVLIEDAANYDPRLYVTSITGLFQRQPSVKNISDWGLYRLHHIYGL